ncbi:MAG: histidine phosphatase family protein [Nitrospinae bacterium]|nr:histidine phosphatase family protein [Nitrospinota bacterium]
MAQKIILVRHGVTTANSEGRFIGAMDLPLSEEGVAQAKALAGPFSAARISRVRTSPLLRAAQTARIAFDSSGAVMETVDELREANFGAWESLTFAEIKERYGREAGKWLAGDLDFAFPGGDHMGEFALRAGRVAESLRDSPEEVALAVTHGGLISLTLCHLLGLPLSRHINFRLAPASVTVIDRIEGVCALRCVLDPQNRYLAPRRSA